MYPIPYAHNRYFLWLALAPANLGPENIRGKYSFNIYCQFGVVRHVHVVGSPERQIIVLVLIVEVKTWKENKYELIWKIIRLYTSNKFICYQNCMWKKVRFSGNEIFIELRRAEKGLCNILSDKYKIFITFLIFKLHFLR